MIEKMIDSIDFEVLFACYLKLSNLQLPEQCIERQKQVLKEKFEKDKASKIALYNTIKQSRLVDLQN